MGGGGQVIGNGRNTGVTAGQMGVVGSETWQGEKQTTKM